MRAAIAKDLETSGVDAFMEVIHLRDNLASFGAAAFAGILLVAFDVWLTKRIHTERDKVYTEEIEEAISPSTCPVDEYGMREE